MDEAPSFISDSKLLTGAYELARSAHHGPARRGQTDVAHPVSVAKLLHEHGFDEQVVAAALLHDVIEDTTVDLEAVAEPFGPEICRLVAEMTEDQSIESYGERKAEHRARVSRDRRAAAIYAADKLAKARDLRGRAHEASDEQLNHYVQTLRTLSEAHPQLPFLVQLRDELAELRRERNR